LYRELAEDVLVRADIATVEEKFAAIRDVPPAHV
jgi:hypothetical protein